MEYIIVKEGVIIEHCCGDSLPYNAIKVPNGFPGYIGMKFDALLPDFSGIKSISQQVEEGILIIPEGFKSNKEDNSLIRMNQKEIDEIFTPEIWAVPETFEEIIVKKTFNSEGDFDYFPPDKTIKMLSSQPAPYYKATSTGYWIEDKIEKNKLSISSSKQERADAVSKITVEIDGMVFDGDEISQERMSRTVVAAAATGETGDATTTWVLHDNTIAQPTISQLARALRAAGEAQTKLWTIPYEDKVDESTESSEAVAE